MFSFVLQSGALWYLWDAPIVPIPSFYNMIARDCKSLPEPVLTKYNSPFDRFTYTVELN